MAESNGFVKGCKTNIINVSSFELGKYNRYLII